MTSPTLDALLAGPRYHAYTYSYPHKTAYRPLADSPALSQVWAGEDRSSLFLYVHVPFCEMRCGFCNLFTQVGAEPALTGRYIDQLTVQIERVRESLGRARFARVALGGGTPTFLSPFELARIFALVESLTGSLSAVPVGIETSPGTATDDRLRLLRERGVDRVSIGVQSFLDRELKALGRPTTAAAAIDAVQRIRKLAFPTLNLDLIYGIPGQSAASWGESIDMALRMEPEELYLYPLYVRPLTGLGRRGDDPGDLRAELYERGRDRLLTAGYEQISLRMFRRRGHAGPGAPVYCCQDDGMVGLGCGARSYTRRLHYADDWAVAARSVKGIIADWLQRRPDSFARAHYGVALDDDEQRRRFVIQSIAIADGLDRERYRERFGSEATDDFPGLPQLVDRGLLHATPGRLIPTAQGLAWADAIGPWFYSDAVRQRMEGFVLR